ncbi:MAG: prephenate dehydrogenase, partial [Nitrospirae bacterium]
MSEVDFKRVCIVGVGLIGGSLGGAIKKRWAHAVEVIGVGRTKENLELARQRGLIDRWSLDVEEAVSSADLLVLATPLNKYEEIIRAARDHIGLGTTVTDVGSVKAEVVSLLRGLLPQGVSFVGAHPIAGSEKSGAQNATVDLFEGSLCIVTPVEETPKEAVERISSFWRSLGSEVVQMSPEEHDRIFALVSHLPHVIAYALVRTVKARLPEAINYAGRGFKDTTRIARSPASLWADICRHNRDNLIEFIEGFIDEMKRTMDILKGDSLQDLDAFFQEAVD